MYIYLPICIHYIIYIIQSNPIYIYLSISQRRSYRNKMAVGGKYFIIYSSDKGLVTTSSCSVLLQR